MRLSGFPGQARSRWRRQAALLLMFASGFAGLGYQIVWTQQSALWLGHESAAVLAVVTAFFGGLAAGAWLLGTRIENSTRPARWYAALELTIASWSLVLALAMAPFSSWMLELTGVEPTALWQWTVAFFGTFLLLAPATAAMGATLPAMARITARMGSEAWSIAPLYAANTFGAVAGVLAIAFWLIPGFGLLRTASVCIALNMLCAVTALALFRGTSPPPAIADKADRAVRSALLTRLAVTGLLGIGYEVLVVRVLSQVAEDTVYTFAMLLAVYLVGSAAGAASYERWLFKYRDPKHLLDSLLAALAAACLAGTASLWAADSSKMLALHMLGPGMAAAIAAEAVVAFAAFGLPTLVMGALFSHLSAGAVASGIGFGRVLAVNTLGAAAAPLLFGVLAFPTIGPKRSLLLIAFGYLLLTAPRRWRRPVVWAPAAALVAMLLWAPRLAFIEIPAGGHLVSYREGVMAAVSVVEDADGVARLRIDNRQQEGSSSSLHFDARQAWLPLLLHPAPRRALFLGLGTGVTAFSATADPELQVDAVELLPEVIASSYYFTKIFLEDVSRPRIQVVAADARRYVRTSKRLYDVIVADNFHPARSGSGSLYTVEHFEAVRARLRTNGIFCQWLPLHQLDLETLRSIVKSFLAAYPDGWAMLASNSLETPVLGLVARKDGGRLALGMLRDRVARAPLPPRLAGLGIEDEFALLGGFVAGAEALQQFAADAPVNTDDHPVVAYRAPRITYQPDSLPRDRLIALLGELHIEPAELIAPSADTRSRQRLAAYWRARDQFIRAGRDVRPSSDVAAMLAQVREPLLAVLRISPDFRPAYEPLVLMARLQARTDPASARALLSEVMAIQPNRPEAEQALRGIGTAPP